MRNRIAAVAAAVLLGAGGALAAASSASASTLPPPDGGSWDHNWTTTDALHGGTIYVEEHGDMIYLCDTASDGLAPRARIFAQEASGDYIQRYTLTASDGKGSCTGHDASEGGVYDLAENDNISVDLFLGPLPGSYHDDRTFLNDH
ncbi:MAG TPA: hypothetical protein VGN37_04760 [Actinocatenispora sp.]